MGCGLLLLSVDPLLQFNEDPLLPSVALGKDPVCRVLMSYRVFCPRHSAKYLFAEFRVFAELGTRQRYYCRVPDIMHSAKGLTLGKGKNFGSAGYKAKARSEG